MYLISLILFLFSSLVFSQLTWEVSTTISPVSSYRGATAVYTEFDKQWILIFGGWSTSSGNFNENYIYDYETDSWYEGWTVPENTKGGSAVNAYNYVYLLTGNDGADNNINSQTFLKLEVGSATWEYLPDYPIAARYVAMTINSNNGLIYCAGGSGDYYAAIDQVNVYNPWDDTWASCTSLPYPSSGGSALIFNGQHLYLMGGLINQPYDKVFKGLIDNNDPTIITWLPGASMPVEMAKVSAGYLGNGQIIATDLTGTFIYDISTDLWAEAEAKPTLVKGGNFTSIVIDGVYNFTVAGGKDAGENLVDHIEYLPGDENIKFPATFVLTSAMGEPVENAEIQVSSYTIHTDEAGSAVQYLENGTYDYTAHYGNLVASGSFTVDGESVYIENQLLVSIKEIIEQVSIFPNPAKGKFKIFGAKNSSVEVIDVKGNLVYFSNAIDNNCSINLSEYGAGLYFVKIIQNDGSVSMQKIVIE